MPYILGESGKLADFKLKVTAVKPITTEDEQPLYINSSSTYKYGENGEEKLFNGHVGDGKNVFNLSKLILGNTGVIDITLRQVNVAAPATPAVNSTTITEGDKWLFLKLFGENNLGTLENNGMLVLRAAANTAKLDTTTTKIINNGYFVDETGQIRTVTGIISLTIKASSSGREETVASDGTITLKVDVETDAESKSFEWQRLVDGEWITITGAATETLDVAATDAGDYRCYIRVVNGSGTKGVELYNYTTVKVFTPTPPVNYYSITMPNVEGVTTTPAFGSYVREEGDYFFFSLTLDEAYSESKPVVKANDLVLEPDHNGQYSIYYVNSDIEISITGIEKNVPTGIDNPDDMKARAWGSNGTLYIRTPKAASVKVYSFAGILLKDLGNVSGDTQVNLGKGAYIVVIGQQSFKCRM